MNDAARRHGPRLPTRDASDRAARVHHVPAIGLLSCHQRTSSGLSVHDAAYLELALREGLELATVGQSLRSPAEVLGIPCVGAT